MTRSVSSNFYKNKLNKQQTLSKINAKFCTRVAIHKKFDLLNIIFSGSFAIKYAYDFLNITDSLNIASWFLFYKSSAIFFYLKMTQFSAQQLHVTKICVEKYEFAKCAQTAAS